MMGQCAAAASLLAGWAGAGGDVRADGPDSRLGIVIHSYAIRRRDPGIGFSDPIRFLEYCRSLGARGVQTAIGTRDESFIELVRQTLQASGMYLEGIVQLPRDSDDVGRFEAEIRTAADCGAKIVRTVMLDGRRYEVFDSADAFRRFAAQSFQRLVLAKPVVDRHAVRLAVENHKDWRADELVDIIRRIDSPNIGV
jgi:sugar phosphate isomerase/epimerase